MTSCYLCGCDHKDDRLGACDVCKAAVENRRTLRSERIQKSNETGKKVTIISAILGPIVFAVFAAYMVQPTPYTIKEAGNSYDLVDKYGAVRFAYDKGAYSRLVLYPIIVERVQDPLPNGGASFNIGYVESPELQSEYFQTVLGKQCPASFHSNYTKSISLLLSSDVAADRTKTILRSRQGVAVGGVFLFPHSSEDALLQKPFLVRSIAKSL